MPRRPCSITAWRTRGPTSGSPTSAIPTKGRVWHPGGAHPFIGLNEALVHNGDFANYHSVTRVPGRPQHLSRSSSPTPRSRCCLFDLLEPRLPYPVEYIIEALAPTTETGLRPAARREAADLPADPGGPHPRLARRPLVLHHRPQPGRDEAVPVDGHHRHGHAPAAGLRPAGGRGLDRADLLGETGHRRHPGQPGRARIPRFTPVADMYWNARGGSYTDGGAFLLTVSPAGRRQQVQRAMQRGRQRHWQCQRLAERQWSEPVAPAAASPTATATTRMRVTEQVRRGRGHAPGPAALQSLAAGQDAAASVTLRDRRGA